MAALRLNAMAFNFTVTLLFKGTSQVFSLERVMPPINDTDKLIIIDYLAKNYGE
jgi:hypothetical protein